MFRRGKKPIPRSRLLRERANMSFFIVIMFFAVFGVIVLTEILLIDERDRGGGGGAGGGLGRRGRGGRHHSLSDRPDYDDPVLQMRERDTETARRLHTLCSGKARCKFPRRRRLKTNRERSVFFRKQDDYTLYRVGFDEGLGVFMREERGAAGGAGGVVGGGGGGGGGVGGGRGGGGGGGGGGPHGPHKQSLLQPLIMDAVRAIPEAGAPGAAAGAAAAAAGAAAAPGGIPSGIEARLPGLNASLPAKDGIWQIVSGTRFKFFVFSAFYDRREARTVRIIAATKTRGPDRVWCRLWYNGSAPAPGPAHAQGNASTASSAAKPYSVTVAAKVKVIRENWNLKYSAAFVLCALGKKLAAPSAVSVVSWLRLPPANLLVVRNTDADLAARNLTAGPLGGDPPPQPAPNPKASAANAAPPVSSVAHVPDTIAVCVKPLHFNYNQALHMLEFLELNTILGVQHFTLYNHTLGAQVSCVLRDYMARGVVTLLPWQLNMLSQKEIRTEGLFAALNDCLYRSMYQYAYTALIDLDEYIIPRNHDTLPELVKWMGTRMNTRGTGSYSFQNAFFYLQWEDDAGLGEADRLESGLVTLRKTRRRLKLHPHKQRSKYLCRPEFIVEAGNHFVWEFVPGHGTLNVPPDAAILHHYRVCEFGGDDCIKTASVVDKTAYRYRERLAQRVRRRYRELQLRCDLPPLVDDPLTPPPTPAAPARSPAPANDSHDEDHAAAAANHKLKPAAELS